MGEEDDDDDDDDDDEAEKDVADAEDVVSIGGCENRYDDDVDDDDADNVVVAVVATAARSSLIHTFLSLLT